MKCTRCKIGKSLQLFNSLLCSNKKCDFYDQKWAEECLEFSQVINADQRVIYFGTTTTNIGTTFNYYIEWNNNDLQT